MENETEKRVEGGRDLTRNATRQLFVRNEEYQENSKLGH
jgi:hypothetical protein